jgi:hypothetical protein
MMLKPILLPIKSVSFNTAYETKSILILFEGFLLFSHIGKLINDNSANNLTDNELDNEQIDKV